MSRNRHLSTGTVSDIFNFHLPNSLTTGLELQNFQSFQFVRRRNPRIVRRLTRRFGTIFPYIPRNWGIPSVPGFNYSTMDASNHPILESPNLMPEIIPDEMTLLPVDTVLNTTVTGEQITRVETFAPADSLITACQSTGIGEPRGEVTAEEILTASMASPIHTVVVDGKPYSVNELIMVINRLKQNVRACTERIHWLESELAKAQTALHLRDHDVHKLRSVLDQKVPSSNLTTITDPPQYLGLEAISAQHQLPKETERIKKQGVSGESHDGLQTSGIVHVHKDPNNCDVIRQAIQNNDFLRHLDKSQIEEIVRCMYKKLIPQGSYVIREGHTGDALYVVAEGILEVSKGGQILGQMDVGRAFGELALLYNCNRTASVRAVTMASAWTLDRRVFQQIMMSSCLLQHQENIQFLSSVPALKGLSQAKLHKLADVVEPVNYGPDEYIIREGEIGETFFIIKAGKVRVTKAVSPLENVEEIRQLGQGEWFGEKALYNSEKRSANVISMEPGVQLLSLDRSNFIHLIGDLNEIKSRDYGDKTYSRMSTSSLSEVGTPGAVTAGQLQLPSPVAAEPIFDVEMKLQKEHFTTIAILGTGGFGCVELVVWKQNPSRSFALKRMKKQHIVQTRQQEHICSERRIMLQLRSPFICQLYATFKDNKYVYLVMEACLGGELWTILRNCGRFNDVVTRFTVACVLEALTYMHTHGIIYRDLKPENLLLDENGYVKLCDFGFAKQLSLGKKTWTFCGTPEYVAPEIILNKGHDYSADYWSLGILIYELLTGSPPFTGSDPMRIYNVVLRGIESIEFPMLLVSRTASALIRRLCAQNPTQRLGYGVGGVIEIKQNKYFQGFDWIGLHRRTLVAPIQPSISGPTDVSNFDKYPENYENPPDELSGWDADF